MLLQPRRIARPRLAAALQILRMHPQPRPGAQQDQPAQLLRVLQGIAHSNRPAHRMPAQHHILVAARPDKPPHPFQIAIHAFARLPIGMAGQVNGLGAAKVPQLVVKRKAGTARPMQKNQLHPQFSHHLAIAIDDTISLIVSIQPRILPKATMIFKDLAGYGGKPALSR